MPLEGRNAVDTAVATGVSYKLKIGIAVGALGASALLAAAGFNNFRISVQNVDQNCLVNSGSYCVIGNFCYTKGESNPANTCQVCDPAVNNRAWSNKAQGTTCDDKNGCTQNTHCQAGQCIPGIVEACSDGLFCTLDSCASTGPTTFSCTNAQDLTCNLGPRSSVGLVAFWPFDDFARCVRSALPGGLTTAERDSCQSNFIVRDQTANPVDITLQAANVWNNGRVSWLDNKIDLDWHDDVFSPTGNIWPVRAAGTGNNNWIDDNGIAINNTTGVPNASITGSDQAGHIVNALKASNAFTIELWLAAGTALQDKPIFWMGDFSAANYNFKIVQEGEVLYYVWREKYRIGTITPGKIHQVKIQWDGERLSTSLASTGILAITVAPTLQERVDGTLTWQQNDIQIGKEWRGAIYFIAIYDNAQGGGASDWLSGPYVNDRDGDGYIDKNFSNNPDVAFDGDCNITDAEIFPGAPEVCDATDNDCDGTVDEGFDAGKACSAGIGSCMLNGSKICSADKLSTVCSVTSGRPVGTPCFDGNNCSYNDFCSGGPNSVCTGIFYVCNDGLACTNDMCTGTDANRDGRGDCSYTVDTGLCLIAGTCYSKGTNNPTSQCQTCNPSVSKTSWSNKAAGTACNADSNGCTQNDACSSSGTCVVGAATACNDASSCTTDVCTSTGANTYTCSNTVSGTSCLINGVCYANGAVNPANGCQICNPNSSRTAWTNKSNGSACNADSNGCTRNDSCQAGTCIAGIVQTCNDFRTCTTDVCASTGANTYTCSNAVNTGSCMINGMCYAHGAPNPINSCQFCSSFNPNFWSSAPAGYKCNDGNAATANDTCSASGVCVGQ